MAYKRKPYRYKLRYKLLFWSLIGMIVFSVAAAFFNRPSTGTIVKPSLEDSPREAEPAKTNTITTKYFSLDYTAGLDTVSDISNGDKTALEVYRVARNDATGRRTFVITVKNLPKGGMSEESSYRLRQINPATYRESNETFGENPFVIMQKLDGTEITAFNVHEDKLAMLAYTQAAPDSKVREEVTELLNGFRWLD